MAAGFHVSRDWAPGRGASLAAHLRVAAAEAERVAGFRLGAAAVFVSNPKRPELVVDAAGAAEVRAFLAASGIRGVAHSTYGASPWGANGARGRAFVRRELAVCAAAGLEGLVVHLPKAPPAEVAAVAGELLRPAGGAGADAEGEDGEDGEEDEGGAGGAGRAGGAGGAGPRIFFETPAVVPAGGCYYETPAKLGVLFDALRAADPGLDRFGLCVDTAHLWTSGVELGPREAAEAWLGELEALGPRLPPVMLHLNDSGRPRGRGPDVHAPLLRGEIWGRWEGAPGACGLAPFADFARRRGALAILERREHADALADLRVLAALGFGAEA